MSRPPITDEQYGDKEFSHGCSGKLKYPSKGHAKAAIRRMIRGGFAQYDGRFLNPYKCKWCGSKWHVGNNRRIDLKENP